MEVESGVTRSIIDELHFWDIVGDEMKGESIGKVGVSLMDFVVPISKELKCKLKVLLLEVLLMNLILGYRRRSNRR